MKEPSYTDEENPIDRSTAMTNNQPRSGGSPIMLVEDEEDPENYLYEEANTLRGGPGGWVIFGACATNLSLG